MARERMVTRTINSMIYSVMVVDTATKTVETVEVKLASADTMTEKAIDKAIKDNLPDGKLFVQITGTAKCMELYGMSEADFMRSAKLLPPRSQASEE